MRDEFSNQTKELLAKRVGYRCSNPGCRHATSGPQENPTKAINIGVAAHVTAASPDGARYDSSLTPEDRASPENGVWLCQSCGKLVDNDALRYTVETLRQWKAVAEAAAVHELERRQRPASDDEAFRRLERLMPDLLREMRQDLVGSPLQREFLVLKRSWTYSGRGEKLFVYYFDDHPDLESKLRILENEGFIRDRTYNNAPRFVISETLAQYLGAL